MTRAQLCLIVTSAARRRVFGEYHASEPSRFLGEIPVELMDVVAPAYSAPAATTFGRSRRGRNRFHRTDQEFQPDYGYSYEDEDQTVVSVSPGPRVRHPTFGVGTILSVEPLTDDMKLTVRFTDIGQKILRAKFAKLPMA